jgi:hypothetical protein
MPLRVASSIFPEQNGNPFSCARTSPRVNSQRPSRTNPDTFHLASRFGFDDPKTCGVPRAARVLACGRSHTCLWTPDRPSRQVSRLRDTTGILRRSRPICCSPRGAGHGTRGSQFVGHLHRSTCCPSTGKAGSECYQCSDYPAGQFLPTSGDTVHRS